MAISFDDSGVLYVYYEADDVSYALNDTIADVLRAYSYVDAVHDIRRGDFGVVENNFLMAMPKREMNFTKAQIAELQEAATQHAIAVYAEA